VSTPQNRNCQLPSNAELPSPDTPNEGFCRAFRLACRGRGVRSKLAVVLLAVVAATSAHAATRYDPRLHFRTWRTPHFDIHAHQGEEALAARLSAIAEQVRGRLEPALGAPRGRVQVILVDQTDLANGWATPFPYDAIEITAVPPSPEELIGNTTDWLELAFTHEYTHILHLDRSRAFMNGVRHVFGRAPFVFSNTFLPIWQIEGLATYEESRQTGAGRIPAGDFRALVDAAARQHRFASIDRASGGLDDWPGGNAAYAYGAYFHQYLSDRYGPQRLDALADATAGRLPLFGAGAFRSVYGKPLGDLWREFETERVQQAATGGTTDSVARRLTHDGFVVDAPRVGADGRIYYRTSNADGFPALMALEGNAARRLAWRVLGDRTSVRGDWIVFDQLARVRSVALLSDLYALPRRGGSVVRLTNEARAAQPDLSPDGRRIACVVLRPGRRALALLDFDPAGPPRAPRVIVDDPASDFTGPRWSPDGTQIVAERRHDDAYELVLIDPATGGVRPIVSRHDARVVTPSWTADGSVVLFAAAPRDAVFNLFGIDVRSGVTLQITDSRTGATAPEVTPTGSIVYVGYSADGYDLYLLPAAGFHMAEPPPVADHEAARPVDASRPPPPVGTAEMAYAPLRTLPPTYWQPVAYTDAGETLVGAGTAMSDALGRHSYAASAAWSGARARPDWSVSYAYDRRRPTLFASYGDDTDPIQGGDQRTREVFAGALLPFRHVRWSQTLLAGFDAERDSAACTSQCRGETRDLRSVRGGWLFDGRRTFGYSISPEEGGVLELAVEGSRAGPGATAATGIVDARWFQRVLSRHTVLALRAAAAMSAGDARAQRIFSAAGPGASGPGFDFGRDSIGLLRGFDPEDVVGAHAAVVNADLRFPLRRVERGAGTWPIFVRSLHAAVFADAGNGWDAAFRAADLRTALGGELSSDTVLVYSFHLTIAGGAAWTHDPVAARDRASFFARFGYAF
jgi:WD40-like Beta Propeller Repeat